MDSYSWVGPSGTEPSMIRVDESGVTFGGGPRFGEWGGSYSLEDFVARGAREIEGRDFPAEVIAAAVAHAKTLLGGG